MLLNATNSGPHLLPPEVDCIGYRLWKLKIQIPGTRASLLFEASITADKCLSTLSAEFTNSAFDVTVNGPEAVVSHRRGHPQLV